VSGTRLVSEVDHAQRRVEHRVEHVKNVIASDSKDGIDALG
jgi:hypothetical protein